MHAYICVGGYIYISSLFIYTSYFPYLDYKLKEEGIDMLFSSMFLKLPTPMLFT